MSQIILLLPVGSMGIIGLLGIFWVTAQHSKQYVTGESKYINAHAQMGDTGFEPVTSCL